MLPDVKHYKGSSARAYPVGPPKHLPVALIPDAGFGCCA